MSKRNLVLFTPLPPARNGIADYTAAFLHDLADEFNLFLVIDDQQPSPTAAVGMVLRIPEYLRHERSFSRIPHAFQLGNNSGHSYMLPYIERHPGLTTIHDLSIHHLMDHTLVGHELGEPYQELMFEGYGQWGLELARQVSRRHERSEIYHTELGFLPVVVRRSLGIVTHSQLGHLRLAACREACPVFVIPHSYQPRAAEFFGSRKEVRTRARALVGLPADAMILMSVGFVTKAKCLDQVLGALRILLDAGRDCLCVVAGELRPDDYDLSARIAHYDVGDNVVVRDFVPDDEFLAYLAAADILMNLRYPSMGETSGSLTNALSIGSSAVITEIGAFAELPDSCAIRVPIEEMTNEGVAARLFPLVDSPDLRSFYEKNSARFARREFEPAAFVSRYCAALDQTVFSQSSARVYRPERRWQLLPKHARRDVESCALALGYKPDRTAQLWWREMLLPLGQSSDCLIVCADDPFVSELAGKAFGWEDGQCRQIRSADLVERVNGAEADVVLLILDEEEMAARGLFLFGGASKVLRPGGILIVDMRLSGRQALRDLLRGGIHDEETSHPDLSDHELLACVLESCGFRLDQLTDRFSEITREEITEIPRRLELVVEATKISDIVISYPRPIFCDYGMV